MREVGFTKIHVFRYSRREGTPAASRTDQIPAEIKERRAHELSDLGDRLRIQYAQRHIGSHELVVVEQEGLELARYLKPVEKDTVTGATRKKGNPVLFTVGDSS